MQLDILLIGFRRILVFFISFIVFYCNLCVCFIVLRLSLVFLCYHFVVNKRFVFCIIVKYPTTPQTRRYTTL